jgi:dipeptidyl-peptidase 4
MFRTLRLHVPLATALAVITLAPALSAQKIPTIEQFIAPGYPLELVAAKKAERVAWLVYERGMRNVYTAAAPAFQPVALTHFTEDGRDISSLNISDDGSVVTFIRGHSLNRDGWVANPTSDPKGAERAIWAARTAGGAAWRIAEGTTPVLSPDGRSVAFARDGQIYRVPVSQTPAVTDEDKAKTPLIKAWGTNTNPRWSPDGSKIAFVSDRVDHTFIGVYDVKTRIVTFLSPGVDHDSSATWSADSQRIAFIRRPGTPFGQQAQPGTGSIGNPPGPAAVQGQGRGRGGRGQGQFQGRGQGQGRGGRGRGDETSLEDESRPGLMTAAFKGGYTLSFWVADVKTGEGHEFWHNAPKDPMFTSINAIQWAGDRVIFASEPEEWIRYYAVSVAGGTTAPIELTPGAGMVENVGVSQDGRTLYYTTNAGDTERRHVWKVPTAGGSAEQLTRGDGIETYPAPLASGKRVAVMSATAIRPQSVSIVAADAGTQQIVYPTLAKDFPLSASVVPQNVVLKAEDGMEFHNQLFVPKDIRPGERRPAIIFVHGGPVRQMLLGYHYMHFYHIAYATNQWLASQGYVVMSVNYRSGIGYGKSFRMAPNTGGRGNAEYGDVLAAGRYLQSRADVDPARVGIWGLSYGGVLTAQALARNSDIFVAGVDLAGVHLWGSSLDPNDVSYQSSAISAIDKWKSPVLLVHGDDDRNVQFSQTTGLVQLLRAHDVYHELIVFPDDVHESLLHKRWIYTFGRMEAFLNRFLKGAPGKTTTAGQ